MRHRFAQLGGMDDVADEPTILNFRRLPETHGLDEEGQHAVRHGRVDRHQETDAADYRHDAQPRRRGRKTLFDMAASALHTP